MRKTLVVLGAFLLLAVFMSSCEKETSVENTPLNPSPVTGDFRAKINGTQWIANKVAIAEKDSNMWVLTGESTDGKLLTIMLTDSSVHNYKLDENSLNIAAYSDSASAISTPWETSASVYDSLAGGTVNITQIDSVNKKITGTFTFKVFRNADTSKVTFTEGSFTRISYADTSASHIPGGGGNPGNGLDTFTVQTGGAVWGANTLSDTTAQGFIALTSIASTKMITLYIPETAGVGTLSFGLFPGSTTAQATYLDLTNQNAYVSNAGTMTIIEKNATTRRIRGNFSFTGINQSMQTMQFTAGYFSFKY